MTWEEKLLIGLSAFAVYNEIMKQKQDPPIYYVGSIYGGFNAATIPPFGIFITEAQRGNKMLLDHELIHWEQYRRMGLMPFYNTYSDEIKEFGYDLAPMELEARTRSGEKHVYNYTQAIRSGAALTAFNPNFRDPEKVLYLQ